MRHIHNRLLIWLLLLSVVPSLFIGGFSYWRSSQAIQEKLNRSSQTLLQQILTSLDDNIFKINKYLDIMFSSDKIQELLRTVDFVRQTGDTFQAYYELDPMLKSMLYNDNSVKTIMLLPTQGGCYFYKGYLQDSNTIRQTEWFKNIEEGNGTIVWYGLIKNPDQLSTSEMVYAVGRTIKDTAFKRDVADIGVIVVLLEPKVFSDIYLDAEIDQNNQIAVYDNRQTLVSKSMTASQVWPANLSQTLTANQAASFRDHGGPEDVVMTCSTSPLSLWTVVSRVPYQYYIKEIRIIGLVTLIVTLCCIMAILFVSYFVSRKISAPICRLSQAMGQVGQKDFTVTVPIRSNDEIGLISQGFNQMVVNIRQLFQRVIHEERQKRFAQIRALQYQMNPHFLYNTLGSIRMVAAMRQDKDVADMILVLNRLLRNTIRQGGQMVSVAEEVINLKDFITLTQIRYKNRLFVTYDIDPDIDQYRLPGMILQPLAENAILHGLSDKLNAGDCEASIKITGTTTTTRLILEIFDNGKGIPQQVIDQVLHQCQDSKTGSDMHIGIKNTDDRIKLEFGQEYGLAITSQPDEFTNIRIELPLIMKDDQYDTNTAS